MWSLERFFQHLEAVKVPQIEGLGIVRQASFLSLAQPLSPSQTWYNAGAADYVMNHFHFTVTQQGHYVTVPSPIIA